MTCYKPRARWLLPRQPSRLVAGLDTPREECTSIELLCGSLHFPCLRLLQSLLRERCKSVERTCIKHNSVLSSKKRYVCKSAPGGSSPSSNSQGARSGAPWLTCAEHPDQGAGRSRKYPSCC